MKNAPGNLMKRGIYRQLFMSCLITFFILLFSSRTHAANEFKFCSHLPVVVVRLTDKPFPVVDMNDPIASKAKRTVALTVYDDNPNDDANGKLNCTTAATAGAEIKAVMHYRGSSSLGFPKHQFSVKLNEETRFLGMPFGGKSWIFSAEQPNLDGTYLRNSLSFYLQNQFTQLMPEESKTWGPRTRFFELFIQNPDEVTPQYAGLYVVDEAIEFNKNRINVNKKTPAILYKIDQPSAKECDITVRDTVTNETFIVDDTKGIDLVPQDDKKCKFDLPGFWPEAFSYWSSAVKTDGPYTEIVKVNGNDQKILVKTDPDSFAVTFLLNEIIKDPDGYNRNTFFYQVYDAAKDNSLTMFSGPLWDKNLGYDLKLPQAQFPVTGGYMGYGTPYSGTDGWTFKIKYQFWKDVLRDPEVQKKICYYWTEGRTKNILTKDAILKFIDDKTKWIDKHAGDGSTNSPVQRDCQRYFPNTQCYTEFNSKPGITSKIDLLNSYMTGRMDWLTEQLGTTNEECFSKIRNIVY
jgi:CotH kinase protein